MPWQAYVLAHNFLSALTAILARTLGLKQQKLEYITVIAIYTSVVLVGIIYIALRGSWGLIDASNLTSNLPFLAVGGLLFAAKQLLTLKLFKFVPASIGEVMAMFNALFGTLAAFLFLEEKLTIIQFAGALLIMLGVYAASLIGEKKTEKRNFMLGLTIALSAAFLWALATVNEKYLLDQMGLDNYVLFGWGFQLLAALAIIFLFKKEFTLPKNSKDKFLIFIMGGIYAIGGFFFVSSLVGSDNAGIVSAASGSKVIFTVILAYILLQERNKLKLRIAAGIVTSLGVGLLLG